MAIALAGCQNPGAWRQDTRPSAADLPRVDTYPIADTTDIVGNLYRVTVGQDDTLFDIARRYNLGINDLVAANPDVDEWLPAEGAPIVLPTQHILPDTPHEGIVLNLATMRLFYYPKPEEGEQAVVITHPLGIGRQGWQTPQGLTKITKKDLDPSWHVPASIRKEHAEAGDPLPAVVPPGPENPLGKHVLRLAMPSYLIHGTNKPAGIGMRVSHGCVRMYPEDIAKLFDSVPVGTPVRIVNQPYLAGWKGGQLYLEAHKPLAEEQHAWGNSVEPMAKLVKKAFAERAVPDSRIDWQIAEQQARSGLGFPVGISVGAWDIQQVIAALPVYETPRSVPEAVDATSSAPRDPSQWYIHAGSFQLERNAKRLAAMIRHLGPPISSRYLVSKGRHGVLAGPFTTRKEAEKNADRIESNFGANTRILEPEYL